MGCVGGGRTRRQKHPDSDSLSAPSDTREEILPTHRRVCSVSGRLIGFHSALVEPGRVFVSSERRRAVGGPDHPLRAAPVLFELLFIHVDSLL